MTGRPPAGHPEATYEDPDMNFRPKSARPSPLATLRRLTGSAVLMLVAAGCAGDEVPLPCPQIVVVKDASRQVRFNGAGQDLTDVIFEAKIEGSGVACQYDDNVLEVDMRVRLEAARGPADDDERADLKYFVAVARNDLTILAREEFATQIPLPGNQTRAAKFLQITRSTLIYRLQKYGLAHLEDPSGSEDAPSSASRARILER